MTEPIHHVSAVILSVDQSVTLYHLTIECHFHDGLHIRDQAFASMLLCPCVSHYSDDSRMLLEGTTTWHSFSWKALLEPSCRGAHHPSCAGWWLGSVSGSFEISKGTARWCISPWIWLKCCNGITHSSVCSTVKPSCTFCLFCQAQSNFSCRIEDHCESQVHHIFHNFEAHGPWCFTVFIQQIEAFPWLCGSALGAAHCSLHSLLGSSSSWIYGAKCNRGVANPAKEMEDVHKCMVPLVWWMWYVWCSELTLTDYITKSLSGTYSMS